MESQVENDMVHYKPQYRIERVGDGMVLCAHCGEEVAANENDECRCTRVSQTIQRLDAPMFAEARERLGRMSFCEREAVLVRAYGPSYKPRKGPECR